MITYDLVLHKQQLIGAEKFSVAANANRSICLHFHFDRYWRQFDSKAVVFRNSDAQYYIIPVRYDRVGVPWEVLTKTGSFEISVIGYEKEKVITSTKAEIIVSENLLPEDCLTLSPTEVLFDRIRQECLDEAHEFYKDEIDELKREKAAEKMRYESELAQADKKLQAAVESKDEEIALLEQTHSATVKEYQQTIAEINSELDDCRERAEKWDLVDIALQGKTLASSPLWGGGTEEYRLPMLNTSSIKSFVARNFDNYLREVGLDLSSATMFTQIFTDKDSIQKLVLKNNGNVTSYESLVSGCTSIRYLDLGDLSNCNILMSVANGATKLEKIRFENMIRVSNMDDAFYDCPVLREFDGVFDMRTISSAVSPFEYLPMLETIRFLENTIAQDLSFAQSVVLSKESLLSIANGLSDSVSGILTLSSYAVENAFPDEQERAEFLSLIQQEKRWNLELV